MVKCFFFFCTPVCLAPFLLSNSFHQRSNMLLKFSSWYDCVGAAQLQTHILTNRKARNVINKYRLRISVTSLKIFSFTLRIYENLPQISSFMIILTPSYVRLFSALLLQCNWKICVCRQFKSHLYVLWFCLQVREATKAVIGVLSYILLIFLNKVAGDLQVGIFLLEKMRISMKNLETSVE